ncbi:uncharacterized protein TNCV_1176281 [Trichonephila clavipes]|nr:uncharacterized protein TNCV_1176281 [Trichonephila clavipes]
MVKFKDFCELWFLPESVATVAAIVGDHRCHTPRHWFKEALDVFLKYSRPSSFHTLQKLIWCGSLMCNLGQSLSTHGPHVFYRRKIRRASRPGKQFNLVTDEQPLDTHYPVEIWLWPSPEGKEGQLAATPQRCSAGCLKYRHCVLEKCERDIQYRPTP